MEDNKNNEISTEELYMTYQKIEEFIKYLDSCILDVEEDEVNE